MTMSQVAKLLTLIFFSPLLMMSLYCTQLAFEWIDFRPCILIVVVVVDISLFDNFKQFMSCQEVPF